MKLLLDENLSNKIVNQISDLYPHSVHVKTLGLTSTIDSIIWQYASDHDFAIVSKDSDFYDRSLILGHPPKVLYLRVKNCSTPTIVKILRAKDKRGGYIFKL